MSGYDIDMFKVKKLNNLKIPIASFYKSESEDWHPKRYDNDDGTAIFNFGFELRIEGSIENEILLVTSICFRGLGSGFSMLEILEPALKNSTGPSFF